MNMPIVKRCMLVKSRPSSARHSATQKGQANRERRDTCQLNSRNNSWNHFRPQKVSRRNVRVVSGKFKNASGNFAGFGGQSNDGPPTLRLVSDVWHRTRCPASLVSQQASIFPSFVSRVTPVARVMQALQKCPVVVVSPSPARIERHLLQYLDIIVKMFPSI